MLKLAFEAEHEPVIGIKHSQKFSSIHSIAVAEELKETGNSALFHLRSETPQQVDLVHYRALIYSNTIIVIRNAFLSFYILHEMLEHFEQMS